VRIATRLQQRAADAGSKTKNNHFGVLSISCQKGGKRSKLDRKISSYPYLVFVNYILGGISTLS
jgi:hypothetical protein